MLLMLLSITLQILHWYNTEDKDPNYQFKSWENCTGKKLRKWQHQSYLHHLVEVNFNSDVAQNYSTETSVAPVSSINRFGVI